MIRSLSLLGKSWLLFYCVLAMALAFVVPLASYAQTNRNAKAQPGTGGAQKHAATLRANDSPEGSRVSIYSDASLDEYEAYRRGDRFYVKLPGTAVSAAQAKLRGRGFEDLTVQKSGSSTLLSFQLEPGTTARVDQRGNHLDVVFTTPGGSQSPTTASSAPATNTDESNSTRNAGNVPGATTDAGKGESVSGANPPGAPSAASNNQRVTSSTPQSAPSSNQTASGPQNARDSWLGTGDWRTRLKFYGEMARLNWLPILIGVMVVGLLFAFLLARRSKSRQHRNTVKPPKKVGGREVSKSPAIVVMPKSEHLSEITSATAVTPATSSHETPSHSSLTGADVLPATQRGAEQIVDVARVQAEATSMLAGASYDNDVTGTVDVGAREVIATELLSALAGRNPERRERAREAFIKSGYFDDATRDLRVAEAPAERVSAARKLALVRDLDATPHLVAALEDEAPEVRRAAVEALADLRDPTAIPPLNDLLRTEKDRKVTQAVIRHAIEACATVEQPATPMSGPGPRSFVPPEVSSAPIEPDREVIEI